MRDALAGKLNHIIIEVEQIEITQQLVGDYFNDPQFKKALSTMVKSTLEN